MSLTQVWRQCLLLTQRHILPSWVLSRKGGQCNAPEHQLVLCSCVNAVCVFCGPARGYGLGVYMGAQRSRKYAHQALSPRPYENMQYALVVQASSANKAPRLL